MNKLPKYGKLNGIYPKILIVCCFLLAILLVVYLLVRIIVPTLGPAYEYQRLRSAYPGYGDLEWTQNIGGSLDEQNIASFVDSKGNTVIFGNTASKDFDFDMEGGYFAVLDSDGSTTNFVALGEYGVGRIVKVIIAGNNYIVLHDDGKDGLNVSLTKISLNLQDIDTPKDISLIASVNRTALDIFYNIDTTSPTIFVILNEVPNLATSKNNIVVVAFDLSLNQLKDTTTIADPSYSLLYLQSYLFDSNHLLIFANQQSADMSIKQAIAFDFTAGTSENAKPLIISYDYQALAIIPTYDNEFLIAGKALSGNKVGLFIIITVRNDFTTLINETDMENPLNAGFIPYDETGFYMYCTFENYRSRLFFGNNSSNILYSEVDGFDSINNVNDYIYIDYANKELLITGQASSRDFFVMALKNREIIYRQTFGGDGVEQNAKILLANSTITIVCDTTSGELGKSSRDVPNNYGGFDTLICKMKDNIF